MQLVEERDLRYCWILAAVLVSGCATDKVSSTYVVPAPMNAGSQYAAAAIPQQYDREVRVISDSPAPTKKKGGRTVKAKTVDAVTQYDYRENKVYDVVVTPGRFTTVYLEPGEQIIGQVAVGDAASKNWQVDVTVAGTSGQATQVLLVQAGEPGTKTNALIATNKRTYQLDLKAVRQPAMDAVKWTYGTGGLSPIIGNRGTANYGATGYASGNVMTASLGNTGIGGLGQQQSIPQLSGGFDPTALNTDYTIERESGRPRWKPVMAYDFGTNSTFIKFPKDARELPTIFSESGGPIPFTMQGNGVMQTHVVIDSALLRLGDQAVRIMRGGY